MPGINVNQITSMLAKLPDQSLQQYAAMHKDNPYVVSLAVAESNRRKDLRSAGAMQAGAQPQPKVAEAAIAEMALPEEQGIGRLPAPNMQGMADGGIVGYAEGGEVERYQVGGVAGDLPAGFRPGAPRTYVPTPAGEAEDMPLFQRLLAGGRETGMKYQVEQARARLAAGYGTDADRRLVQEASGFMATTPQDVAAFDAATNLFMTEREAKKAGAPSAAPAPAADTGTKASSGKAPAAAPGPNTSSMSLEGLGKLYQKTLSATKSEDPAAKERGELGAMLESAPKQALEAFEKDVAKRGDVYKAREARLAERESKLGKEKDTLAGLSILEAGLAMMGTRGTLGEAVGAGGRAGLKSYSAGLDKLKAAQEKIDETRDRIEDLRINREDMTAAQRRQLESEVRQGGLAAKKLAIDGIMARDDVNRKEAGIIFDAQIKSLLTDKEVAARMATANPQMQLAKALGGGDLETGLRKLTEIQAGKFSPQQAYMDMVKAWAGKDTTMGGPPSPQEFMTQLKALSMLQTGVPAPVDTSKNLRP